MCSSLYVQEAVAGNGLHRQGTADHWFCNELFQSNEYLRPLDLSEIEVLGSLSSEPRRWLGMLFFCPLLTDRRKCVYVFISVQDVPGMLIDRSHGRKRS